MTRYGMEMTPKTRVQKFFKREPIDIMPIFSGMGMVTIQAINKMGIRFAEVHGSPDYLAKSASLSSEIFGFDSVVVPYDMCTIPEAMGRGCSTYANAEGILYPTVPTKWEDLDAVNINANWVVQNRMPVVEDAIKKLVAEGKYAVGGWVLGPFTLGGQVIELDLLLKGIKKDADRVESVHGKNDESRNRSGKTLSGSRCRLHDDQRNGFRNRPVIPPHVETAHSALFDRDFLSIKIPQDSPHLRWN